MKEIEDTSYHNIESHGEAWVERVANGKPLPAKSLTWYEWLDNKVNGQHICFYCGVPIQFEETE